MLKLFSITLLLGGKKKTTIVLDRHHYYAHIQSFHFFSSTVQNII